MGSDIEFSSDILQPISVQEWPLLQKLLKVDWPLNLNYYNWLENSIKWKRKDPSLAIEIYCPHGKYQDDATFVAISSFGRFEVCIFTKDRFGKRLHEALLQTNRIDWSKKVMFMNVGGSNLPFLLSALAWLRITKGIEIDVVITRWLYMKPFEDCANMEITVPEECDLRELSMSHLPLIHSSWVGSDLEQPEETLRFIGTLLKLNKGVGLFLKESNRLIAWQIQNEWHGVGLVHVLKPYRRKGYMRSLANSTIKHIWEQGITPTVYITPGNTASFNLIPSIGFQSVAPYVTVVMKKKAPVSTRHEKVDLRPPTRSSL